MISLNNQKKCLEIYFGTGKSLLTGIYKYVMWENIKSILIFSPLNESSVKMFSLSGFYHCPCLMCYLPVFDLSCI